MIKVILGIVFGDGLIKRYVDRLEQKVVWQKGICRIRPCRNKGAMYSLGSQKSEWIKWLSTGVLGMVILRWIKQCFHGKNCGKNHGKNVAYSMLIGGSISNVWDRYKKGYVVDYIHIQAKGIEKIIFNLSDVCIVIGGLLLAIAELLEKEKNE